MYYGCTRAIIQEGFFMNKLFKYHYNLFNQFSFIFTKMFEMLNFPSSSYSRRMSDMTDIEESIRFVFHGKTRIIIILFIGCFSDKFLKSSLLMEPNGIDALT